jgi:hypothetical protein
MALAKTDQEKLEQAAAQHASGFVLTKPLPDDTSIWSTEELSTFLEEHVTKDYEGNNGTELAEVIVDLTEFLLSFHTSQQEK